MKVNKYTLYAFMLLHSANAIKKGEKTAQVMKEDRGLFMGTHINPCTGSFSNDLFDPNMDCQTFLQPENPISSPTSDNNAHLSTAPTSTPTVDSSVSQPSSSQSNNDIDNIIYSCPGTSCSYETGENVLTFSYTYTAEVSDTEADPRIFPTLIEEDLVEIIAESVLGYCILPTEGVRNLLQISNEEKQKYKRRRLNVRRRLQATGVCSYPKDYLIPTGKYLNSTII
jgi:hypothetical protein